MTTKTQALRNISTCQRPLAKEIQNAIGTGIRDWTDLKWSNEPTIRVYIPRERYTREDIAHEMQEFERGGWKVTFLKNARCEGEAMEEKIHYDCLILE